MVEKKKCKGCGRLLRTKNFTYNRIVKEPICRTCNKRIGSNIFYSPKTKGNNFISKYSMTEDEKLLLARNNGWERTNKTNAGLKTVAAISRRAKRKENQNIKSKEEKKKQNKKEFLKGLEQCQ